MPLKNCSSQGLVRYGLRSHSFAVISSPGCGSDNVIGLAKRRAGFLCIALVVGRALATKSFARCSSSRARLLMAASSSSDDGSVSGMSSVLGDVAPPKSGTGVLRTYSSAGELGDAPPKAGAGGSGASAGRVAAAAAANT